MKKSVLLYFLFIAIFFAGCDKITGPTREGGNVIVDNPSEQGIVYPDTTFTVQKHVLMEDYTGQTCGNCPEAGLVLEDLINEFGKKIVPLAVHAGSFAMPNPPKYTSDFRNPISTELDNKFGISAFGNPNGMVDRENFGTGNHIVYHTNWRSKVEQRLSIAPASHIAIKNTLYPTSNKIKTDVKVNFISSLTGDYRLSVMLMEDSIISAQKDYSKTPDYDPNYVFNHVLRAAFNGAYGEDIAASPNGSASSPISVTKTYSIDVDSKWNRKQLYVIAYVYNKATYEVIQAQYRKVEK